MQNTYSSIVLIKSDRLYWFLIEELIYKPSIILAHKCICLCVSLYSCKYACNYTSIYVCTYTRVHVYIPMCMHVYMYTYVYIVDAYLELYKCMHINMRTFTHEYKYIHKCTYTYIHVHVLIHTRTPKNLACHKWKKPRAAKLFKEKKWWKQVRAGAVVLWGATYCLETSRNLPKYLPAPFLSPGAGLGMPRDQVFLSNSCQAENPVRAVFLVLLHFQPQEAHR